MQDISSVTTGHVSLSEGIATFTFDGSGHNTFPTEKMNATADFLEGKELQDVSAVIITAGDGRSFGVGGDFKEVSKFKGSDEVDQWIAACVRMYTSVLSQKVPVVAAIDGYCIGIGLQLALCADYRVASPTADLRMPEFKLGIACVLGNRLLSERVAPNIVNRMIMSSEPWTAERALADGLVDEIAGPNISVVAAAKEVAKKFAAYQPVPYATTKRYANSGIISRLEHARVEATKAHRAGFAASQVAQERMREVIGRGRPSA